MGSIRNGLNYKGKKRSTKVDVVQPKHVDRDKRSLLRRIGIKLSDKPDFNTIIAVAENAVAVGDLLPKELVSLTSSIEHNLRSSRTLSDLMPEDIGNVYRDEVSYDDIASLVSKAVNEGKITEERGDEILLDAKNRVFDKDFEQAAKEGGELTIDTARVDDEIANRDEVSTANNTRGVLRKTKRKDKSGGGAQTAIRRSLEQSVESAKADYQLAVRRPDRVSADGVDVKAKLVAEAKRKLEVAELALKSYKDTEVGEGTDLSKGRKIQLNRKLKKVVKRNRGLARKSMFRFFEMTRTRLARIHPDAAARADRFTALQRNATEYFASRIGKEVGDNNAIQKGYEDSINKVKSPEREKYEAFIAQLNAYVRKHDKNFKPVASKVHLDLHAVERNRGGFLSILREAGVKNPEATLDSILDGRGYPEYAIRPELSNQPRSGVGC